MSQLNRIVFINGPWQTVAALATLRHVGATQEDTHLVLVDSPGSEAKVVRQKIVDAVAPGWPQDQFGAQEGEAVEKQFVQFCSACRERPVELWLNSFHRGYARMACELIPEAPIVMMEDGGRNYVDFSRNQRSSSPSALRRLATAVRGSFRWPGDAAWRTSQLSLPHRLRRICKSYLFLQDVLGSPEYLAGTAEAIPASALKGVLHDIRCAYPELQSLPKSQPARPFLIVGQNLCRGGNITREVETRIYERAIEAVASSGFDVIWKDHPTNRRPFYKELRSVHPSLLQFSASASHAWPLEVSASIWGFLGSASIIGSSLFYLNLLYGTKPWTFANWVLDSLREPYRGQAELFLKCADRLDDLSKSETSDSASPDGPTDRLQPR